MTPVDAETLERRDRTATLRLRELAADFRHELGLAREIPTVARFHGRTIAAQVWETACRDLAELAAQLEAIVDELEKPDGGALGQERDAQA